MQAASVGASTSSHTADDGAVLILENPPPNSERQKRPGKKNLPKEAYQILKDYFFNVNQYPKKPERLELAEQVNRVPGCESSGYTASNVQSYFTNMRKRYTQASSVTVKRELVEEPLSLSGSGLSTNGATFEGNTSSISTAPRKKRKSQATAVSQPTAPMSASASQHLLSSASTNGSFSTLLPPGYPQSSASAPSATPSRKQRTRLKAEGYKVFHDFFNNVSRYPTPAQKAELLAVVTAIPGCEGYTNKKLTAFFSRMRMERKEEVAFVKAESPEFQMNGAIQSASGPPSGSSLVPPSLPEPEAAPVSSAHPLPAPQSAVCTPPPQPQVQPQTQPQPHPQPKPIPQSLALTLPAAKSSQFSVFSIYEPLLCTPQVLSQPHARADPHPPAAGPETTAEHGPAEPPDPPRSPPGPATTQPTSVASAVGPDAAPALPAETAEAQAGDAIIPDSSDPIPRPSPAPSPSPKRSKKQESTSTPTKRAILTDATLKLLDDYYANVSPSPSHSQCAALAAQASELPGGARCTAKQVRKYFRRRKVEEKCEALKDERMGSGPHDEKERPAMVLVAVVEPHFVSDEPRLGVSDGDPETRDPAEDSVARGGDGGEEAVDSQSQLVGPTAEESLPEMLATTGAHSGNPEEPAASILPTASGDGDEQGSAEVVPDVAMEDVSERLEREDAVPGSPLLDHDADSSNVHAEISVEEEGADTGIEGDAEHSELGLFLAEVVPSFETKMDADEPSLKTDLAEDHAAPPLLAPGDVDMDSGGEVVASVPTDNGAESRELEDVVLGSPEPDQPDQCSGNDAHISGQEEPTEEGLETDVDQAGSETEVVPEDELEDESKPDDFEPVCEIVPDALATEDAAEPSAPTLPALDGEDESGSGQSVPEASKDDIPESPESGTAVGLESPESDGHRPEADTPMDMDADPTPSIKQVDVLSLAAQLKRVFSRPPALDAVHPTTFADFATWLEARNGNLVCASS